jgi:hypothetical protein
MTSASRLGPVEKRYAWSADFPGNVTTTVGGNLEGALVFRLMPAIGSGLPRHEVRGVKMVRRFLRHFVRVIDGEGKGNECAHCVVCEGCRLWFQYSNGAVIVTGPEEELYL